MPLAPAFTDLQAAVSAGTLTSASFTPSAGDVLVAKTGTWSTGTDPGTVTDSSGQVWTKWVDESGGSFNGRAALWTAVVGEGGAPDDPGAITVSITPAASCHHALVVEHWPDGQLAATPATGQRFSNSAEAPAATIVTTEDGSAVSWMLYDNNSADPTSRAYRSSATEEYLRNPGGGNGIFYFAYQDAPTAGSQTFGITAPNVKPNMVGIEIQAAETAVAGALAGATPAPSGALAGDVVDAGPLAGTTPAPSGALTGDVVDSAALAGTTPAPSGALSGSLSDAGALAGTTAAPSAALAASVTVAGALAGLTPAPTGSLADTAAAVYPLHIGTVVDNVGRSTPGTVVDNVGRLHAGTIT